MVGSAAYYSINLNFGLDSQTKITPRTTDPTLECGRNVTSEDLYMELQLPRRAHHQLENAGIPDVEVVVVRETLPFEAEPLPLCPASMICHLPLLALAREDCRHILGRKNVVHLGRQELHVEVERHQMKITGRHRSHSS